jgi:ornithine decarboxylase
VRLYAVDCAAEVEKIARAAPGARVFCRILSDCVGAEWPLSRKFGCEPAMAADVLEHAMKLGLEPHGVSFHVGSQQRNPHAWDRALASAAAVFRECGERGMTLAMVNLGGGFPTRYLKNVPTVKTYGASIFRALRKHFGNRIPETIIEPGRGMVGNAGVIEAEVVLVSRKSNEDDVRWVYLDIGKFGGLAETMDESIRYAIPHAARRRRDEPVRARGSDLRFGRRAVRARAVPAAGESRDRRQGADRGHRRLYGDLFGRRLQRFAPLKTVHI